MNDHYQVEEEKARIRAAFAVQPPAPANIEDYEKTMESARALTDTVLEKLEATQHICETEDGLFRIVLGWNYQPLEFTIRPGAFTGRTAQEVSDGLLYALKMLST